MNDLILFRAVSEVQEVPCRSDSRPIITIPPSNGAEASSLMDSGDIRIVHTVCHTAPGARSYHKLSVAAHGEASFAAVGASLLGA